MFLYLLLAAARCYQHRNVRVPSSDEVVVGFLFSLACWVHRHSPFQCPGFCGFWSWVLLSLLLVHVTGPFFRDGLRWSIPGAGCGSLPAPLAGFGDDLLGFFCLSPWVTHLLASGMGWLIWVVGLVLNLGWCFP